MLHIWAVHLSQPIHPTSTHQKTLFTPVNRSLMHFAKHNHITMNTFCAKTLLWCHMATMALSGLKMCIVRSLYYYYSSRLVSLEHKLSMFFFPIDLKNIHNSYQNISINYMILNQWKACILYYDSQEEKSPDM